MDTSNKTGTGFQANFTKSNCSVVAKSLRTILLQNNYLTAAQEILYSKTFFPALRVIQLHGNPTQKGTNSTKNDITKHSDRGTLLSRSTQ